MSLEEEMLASVHGSSSTHSMTAPLSDEAWAAAEEAARALSVHTHVVFYLAQAYAALRVPHESAEYCKVRGRYSLGIHGK